LGRIRGDVLAKEESTVYPPRNVIFRDLRNDGTLKKFTKEFGLKPLNNLLHNIFRGTGGGAPGKNFEN